MIITRQKMAARRLNESRRIRRQRLFEMRRAAMNRRRRLEAKKNEATVALYPYEEIGATIDEFLSECQTLIKGIRSDLKKPLEQLETGDPAELEGEFKLDKLEAIKAGLGSIMKTLGKVAYTAYDIKK